MKKQKPKISRSLHFKIDDPIFMAWIRVFVGFDHDTAVRLTSRWLNTSIPEHIPKLAWAFSAPGIKNCAIWFSERKPRGETVAHEALHVTGHILRTVGVGPMDPGNEELYAYYQDFITRSVLDRVWK